jgi:CheY-like chemotaxis protein
MPPQTPSAAQRRSDGFHVLVIDDDDDLCHLTADYLRPLGFQVESAHLGLEGVERACSGEWHAVILDIMLPDIDGFEVLRRIRAKSKVPVIMRPEMPPERSCLDKTRPRTVEIDVIGLAP